MQSDRLHPEVGIIWSAIMNSSEVEYEHMDIPTAIQVRDAFIRKIRGALTLDQLQEVVERNKVYDKETCASHDFCDANQCMLDAWEQLGQPMDFQNDQQMSVTDQAWQLARQCEFNQLSDCEERMGHEDVQQGITPKMHEYGLDVILKATIRVKAYSPEEAMKSLHSILDAADCNAGAWPNGDPVLFEASTTDDSAPVIFSIDGEDVDAMVDKTSIPGT